MNAHHLTAIEQEPQECPECGVIRRTVETLRVHLELAHGVTA